ncbi:MAG TPA: type I methionyl aminopeptidase [Patescibacteria group bacterium]|jgi:methionyl aminopeptidase|nr:type I methionyl aminopeptidase [Patescibacteria group bacterium]
MNAKYTKTKAEIELIDEGGKILRDILHRAAAMAKPGVSTFEINDFAEREMIKAGGRPSFIGYGSKKNPFLFGLCTSINDAVVHGVPSKQDILRDGDILGLDIGMEYKKLYTDTAITVAVGSISDKAQKLVDVTKLCLDNALKQVKPGNTIGDIGHAIQSTAEGSGFSVVRDLVGHGVGYAVHEDPAVPCYGKPGKGIVLVEDMVLAIEPMVCENKPGIFFDTDGWTIRTHDGGLAAHFEHTIAVTKTGVRILT